MTICWWSAWDMWMLSSGRMKIESGWREYFGDAAMKTNPGSVPEAGRKPSWQKLGGFFVGYSDQRSPRSCVP